MAKQTRRAAGDTPRSPARIADVALENSPSDLTPKGATSRARILDIAARLFDEAGYHGTSMQDIVRAVGISKAGIYHYFASKDDILMAIYTLLVDQLIERQNGHLATPQSATVILRSMIADLVEQMDRHPTHYRVFTDIIIGELRRLSAEARQEILDKRRIIHENFGRVIDLGVQRGEFALSGDRDLIVFGIVGMCWAYQDLEVLPNVKATKAAETFSGLILRGLTNQR
jgi:AcrR family transcriptional regulator